MSLHAARRTSALSLVQCLLLAAAVACNDDTQPPTEPSAGAVTSAPALAIGSNTWRKRADMPGARAFFGVASLQNGVGQSLMYVIGGRGAEGPLSRVQAYNVATNSWSTKASTISALFLPSAVGVIGGKIYVAGGTRDFFNRFNALIVYNPATNKWVHKRSMPIGNYAGVGGVIQDKLYVLAGGDTDMPVFFRYDPAKDLWAALPVPTQQHSFGVAGVIGNKLYVTGGNLAFGDPGKLEVFDPATNAWTTKAHMPVSTERSAAAVVGGRMHVIGGFASNPDGSSRTVRSNFVYDPTLDRWVTRTSLPADAGAIGAATKVFLNGGARIEMVSTPASGNNWQYTP